MYCNRSKWQLMNDEILDQFGQRNLMSTWIICRYFMLWSVMIYMVKKRDPQIRPNHANCLTLHNCMIDIEKKIPIRKNECIKMTTAIYEYHAMHSFRSPSSHLMFVHSCSDFLWVVHGLCADRQWLRRVCPGYHLLRCGVEAVLELGSLHQLDLLLLGHVLDLLESLHKTLCDRGGWYWNLDGVTTEKIALSALLNNCHCLKMRGKKNNRKVAVYVYSILTNFSLQQYIQISIS